MKILITAGGTGGHIYPALALAKALKKDDIKNEILFIGSKTRMESELIPNAGYRFIGLDIIPLRKSFVKLCKGSVKMVKAYFSVKKIIKNEQVDIVIGFGNYISVPVLLAAKHLKVKTMIHEQNALPGKANLFLAKKVDAVIGSYEFNYRYFDENKTFIYGNPRAQEAFETKVDPCILKDYGLDPNKKLILIFMGSLGSSTVNKVMIDYLSNVDDQYQYIYATGKNDYDNTFELLKAKDNVKVFKSVDVIRLLPFTTLAITRAGASTISEISALKTPTILIPSPYVPDNGQFINAKTLVDEKACILLEEKDLDVANLSKLIMDFLKDPNKEQQMKANLERFSYIHSNDDIINKMKKLVGE